MTDVVAAQHRQQEYDDDEPGGVPGPDVDLAPPPRCRRHLGDVDAVEVLHLGTGHGRILLIGFCKECRECKEIVAHPLPDRRGHHKWVTDAPAEGRRRVLVLGSTGSIGTQALEVIAANPDRFEVVGLAAGGANLDTVARQRAETGVTNIAIADDRAAEKVGDVPFRGPEAVTRLVQETEADVVLNALVGALGLRPTLAALASGARLALANKESLVAGGPLVLQAARPGQIVPVDSEHSALAQCLRGGTPDEVAKLVLTASGGPFRGWAAADLEGVTPEQAGAPPTWSRGSSSSKRPCCSASPTTASRSSYTPSRLFIRWSPSSTARRSPKPARPT